MKTPCKFCGEIKPDLLPHNRKVCDDPECRRQQKNYRRRKNLLARKKARLKSQGPRICAVCGKEIELEQDVRRSYCLDPKCVEQYKKEQYVRELKKQREWYHKNKDVIAPEIVIVKKLEPIKKEDWFSQTVYIDKLKKQRKLNGWKCSKCGKPLRGDRRFFCIRCHDLIKRIPDRLDGDWAYESTVGETHGGHYLNFNA